MEKQKYDIIIIGGGPAGATAATVLAQKGFDVKVFEKEIFPRAHVGETLLPFCYDLFKQLGVLEEIEQAFSRKPGARFLNLDGSIYSNYCFNKVIEGPEYLSFHVERAKFDKILLDNARNKGAMVQEGTKVTQVSFEEQSVIVKVKDAKEAVHEYETNFLLDASGQHSFLAKKFRTKQKHKELDRTAFWGHWKHARLIGGLEEGLLQIVYLEGEKQGWIWAIPFKKNDISIGLVLNADYIKGKKPELSGELDWKQAFYKQELNNSPYINEVLKDATMKSEVFINSDYSYNVTSKHSEQFALIGDAGAFIDPIFSTGVFLAMKSALLVAESLSLYLKEPQTNLLAQTYQQIDDAYALVEQMILNYYNPQIPSFHEMHNVFGQHDSAYALLHFLLAGDFFNRHQVYAGFLNQLKHPKKFDRYKNLVYKRSDLEQQSCKKVVNAGVVS